MATSSARRLAREGMQLLGDHATVQVPMPSLIQVCTSLMLLLQILQQGRDEYRKDKIYQRSARLNIALDRSLHARALAWSSLFSSYVTSSVLQ